ncbi:MAG: hypothetical protein AAF869_08210 [Pseudomonadota bacterium]
MSSSFSGRAANDRFSAGGLLPTRQPRRQGVEDLLGGREVADDLEESAPSLFSEPEREKLAADLDGADADAAVDATRTAFGRYKEAKRRVGQNARA